MDWYISRKGDKEGPYSDDQIRALLEERYITPDDLVWSLAVGAWTPAGSILGRLGSISRRGAQPGSGSYRVVTQAVRRQLGKSYFSRHWYGDLSLPVSYWINGSLATLIVALLIIVVPWDDFVSDSPKLFSMAVIAIRLFAILLTVWQVVGIWRSANNHISQGKPSRWGTLAKVAVVLGLINALGELAFVGLPQVTEFVKIAGGSDPLGTYQLRVLRNDTELEITGPIVFGLTNDVVSELDAHPAIRIIHLNSQGGRVAEARKLRDTIASRKLSTFTAAGCFSACTLAYAAGHPRLISRNASLGFHQYSFPGVKQIAFQRDYERDKRDWLARGFHQSFVDRAFTTPSTDMWKPSHRELFAAGVVTGYPNSNDVAISGLQAADLTAIEAEITENPLFAALKQYDPNTYKQLISELGAGFTAGKSQAELRDKILPIAQSVYKQRLPYASGPTLNGVTDLLLEQMSVLYAKDPALCYQYLFPDPERPGLDPTKYFSKELIQRESSMMAEVIRTAATQSTRQPQKEQIEPHLKNVFGRLAQRHGDDARMLGNPELGKKNQAKMCTLTYDLYQTIRRLPEQESASVLRFMFAHAK